MAKLTVIMTIFNMAEYLKDSIESILDQSFQDFELILVVDGGVDQSLEICKEYAEQDERVYWIHTENRGTASARNTGIAVAKGDYIGFIDADDWIEPQFYQQLIGALETSKRDIASCGFVKTEKRQDLKVIGKGKLSELHVYSSEEAIAMTFEKDKMRYSPCNKIYKRELFKSVQYPLGVLYEDKATTYRLFHLANGVAYLDVPMYHYYIHQDSVMRRDLSEGNFSIFKVNEDLIDFMKVHYPKLVGMAERSYQEECEKLLERFSDPQEYVKEREHCLRVIEGLREGSGVCPY